MRIHVAVDAHNLIADDRGIGRYARAVLARALGDPAFRWTLVVRRWFPDRRALAAAVGRPEVAIARAVPHDADVVWFPWNGMFLRTSAPSVATIHDCTPFAFPAARARRREREQAPFRASAASARRLLVQSDYTATEVRRWLGVDAARLVVVPLAADPVFSPGGTDALPAAVRERRYVLCVGAHEPRKNTATLSAAFERAFAPGEMQLAFTRRPPALPRGGVVVDATDDRTLAALYRGATLVAVPSLSEGFGFPLLEAMACGTAALAARAGALPEVGGDATAWIDNPLDVSAWADALRELAADNDARTRLCAAGIARAATFSWRRCTTRTLAVLREVAAAGGAAQAR